MLSPPQRQRQLGFTLIEAVISFAILGLILTGLFSIGLRAVTAEDRAQAKFERLEVARAVLDEYLITKGANGTTGEIGNRWAWAVTERGAGPPQKTSQDHHFRFLRVEIAVWPVTETKDQAETLSSVIARRAPP